MFVNFLVGVLWQRTCDICFNNKCMVRRHFIACYCWVCCIYVLLKYCCLGSIPFFVHWAGITKVSVEVILIFTTKIEIKATAHLGMIFQFWILRFFGCDFPILNFTLFWAWFSNFEFYAFLGVIFQFWILRFENLPSTCDGSSRPLLPMTLLLILLRSSVVKSPFHILDLSGELGYGLTGFDDRRKA